MLSTVTWLHSSSKNKIIPDTDTADTIAQSVAQGDPIPSVFLAAVVE